MNRSLIIRAFMVTASCFALPLVASAVTLNVPPALSPFADTTLPGTTLALRPELAGTVLADLVNPFSFQGVTGTVQNRVVRETGSGTLDFYWKINVDTSSRSATGGLGGITAFRLTDFGASNITDADWRIDGLGSVGPDTARLFNVTTHPTGDVNFLFDPTQLDAGASSRFFFLHTDATSFAQTARFDLLDQDQNLSGIFTTYAPAVPEPGTLALLGAGLLLMMSMGRRGHRAPIR